MKKNCFLLFIYFFGQILFCQKQTILENQIYHKIDVFVAGPTPKAILKLENFEKTLIPKTKSELLAFAILKCNKAFYQNQFGQINNAIASYEHAWQLFDKNKLANYDISESCLVPLGNLYTIIGDYSNAENIIKHYFYIANQENNNSLQYTAIVNLSAVYQNTGKVDEAINLIEKTINKDKLTATQNGVLYGNLGANYMVQLSNRNDFEKAEKALLKSILLLQNDKTQLESRSNVYRNLSKLYEQTNPEKVSFYFEKATNDFFKINNPNPRKVAQFYLEEANFLFRKKQIDAAEKKITEIFKILIPTFLQNNKGLYPETVLLDTFDLQAEIFLTKNQYTKALESYNNSFKVEEMLAVLLIYENSKIITQNRNRDRTEKCIEIYNTLYLKNNKSIYLESAFLLQEKSKSALLNQAVFNKKNMPKDIKLLLNLIQTSNNEIQKEQHKGKLASINKINTALKKLNSLMLLLKSKTKNSVTSEIQFEIKDLYSKLIEDKTILVAYFYGRQHIYVFTLNNNKIKLDCISSSQKTKIVSFLNFFSDSEKITNNVLSYTDQGYLLYKILKLPQKTPLQQIVIIPDGLLNFLPFEVLLTKKSTTSNFAKMDFLVKEFKVGYSNSAQFYLKSNLDKKINKSVLGVFPIFENSILELTFSKSELQNLKSNFDGKFLEKEQATFYNFKKNVKNHSIIHLSTHASSGDLFDAASIQFYDQKILYSEFYTLDIKPNLVVLSACETGLGKLFKGEGAMSVARGFQIAGAQNLLFSLWKVNDYTTAVYMKKFYSNLQNNHSYFDANHKAKLDFLSDKSIPNSKKSPYYWSSFVYYGTLNTDKNNYIIAYFLTFLAVILVIYFYLKFYKLKNKSTVL